MKKSKRTKADRLMRFFILGIGVSPLVLVTLFLALGLVPFNLDTQRSPVLMAPPDPLSRPWISGALGWTFLLACVGFTSLALYLERGRDRRVEPSALIALCLAVLGHGQAIHGALVMARTGAWPVNLIEVALWMLAVASAAGLFAWVRLLLAKRPVRGRVFATCALVCCLATAWIVNTFLVDCWVPPHVEGGVELAVVHHSWPDRPHSDEQRATISVRADGSSSPASLEELVGDTSREDPLQDNRISVRADRRASWSSVRRVIEEVQEAGIWRVSFATRWAEPAAASQIPVYLAIEDGTEPKASRSSTTLATLRVGREGRLMFDDEACVDRDSLLDRLDGLRHEWDHEGVIRIEPDAGAPWSDVIGTLSSVIYTRSFREIHLGAFRLQAGS